jgi:Flp pilus assembly protein TadB
VSKNQGSKTTWLVLLALGVVGLVVAVAMGELIRFLVTVALTTLVLSLVLRRSLRSLEQDNSKNLDG